MSRRRLLTLIAALVLAAPVLAYAFGAAVAPADFQRFSVTTPAGPDEPDPALFHELSQRLVWTVHRVSSKDASLSALAREYNTAPMSLQVTNNDELVLLSPGRRLVVHNGKGRLYEVKKDSETLNQIVAHYHRDKVGAQRFKESIVYANKLPGIALLSDYEFQRGARLLLPNITETWDSFHFPISGFRISSYFGNRFHPLLHRARMHDGLDLAKPWGSPVYPARSGVVVQTGWTEGYGLLIVIKHKDGYTTRYGHLSKILVHVGQTVQRGNTLIGKVGSTGLSTGPHLHFEVRDPKGKPINPMAKIGRR